MKNHFVCTECKYTSSLSGSCQTDDCIKNGAPLTECACEDGKHEGVLQAAGTAVEEQIVPDKTINLDENDGVM